MVEANIEPPGGWYYGNWHSPDSAIGEPFTAEEFERLAG